MFKYIIMQMPQKCHLSRPQHGSVSKPNSYTGPGTEEDLDALCEQMNKSSCIYKVKHISSMLCENST